MLARIAVQKVIKDHAICICRNKEVLNVESQGTALRLFLSIVCGEKCVCVQSHSKHKPFITHIWMAKIMRKTYRKNVFGEIVK